MRRLRSLSLLLALSTPAWAAPSPVPAWELVGTATPAKAELSDVMHVKRPEGGEHFGLYVLGKKVGYVFTDVAFAPGRRDRVVQRMEMYFKAKQGTRESERRVREERVYEARPGGRLVSFVFELKGDGGDQTLEGTATPTGMRVLRKRPGLPNQVLNQPASPEVVEDADSVRVAAFRNAVVRSTVTDSMDLGHYVATATPGGSEQLTAAGVKVRVRKVTALSEKDKVPVEYLLDASGRVLELRFGSIMVARAEPESVAKRLDQVEVFGLTRVVLPKALPAQARAVPGSVTMVVQGLPEKFHRRTERQSYRKRPDGSVEVTINAKPVAAKSARRPLKDPSGGEYLKSSIIIESDSDAIRTMAEQIAGSEKDAHAAALKVNAWVARNLEKSYGASADRATDVLRQRKGDCTEHSLLTVSMLRALGIPARRVDGVVYMVNEDGVPALYWHEWVEAYVGEWTQMDPTFNQAVADAGHLQLGEEAQAEITPLIGSLKVVDVK
ncbi:MAG: transglutaminase-like domain-containing protein [Myxococcaceae bacterium]|nr:transglutaminase-like domain-containing protein [Myxococcaceae bacterium]MCI0670776.1 transglutaminase-like domain-containing protein [Myxococcaceae bacterium]